MAVSRDVARVNFAKFVKRALASARARGLKDTDISDLTGVGPSTFHRWARAEWGEHWPELQKVISFCEGLGFEVEDALDALGLTGTRAPTAPTPLDPLIVRMLARLANPDVSDAEKATIRGIMQYWADQPVPKPRRRRRAE